MIESILVALDGSPVARRVLDAALEVADRFDAKLTLYRAVVVPPDFAAAAYNPTGDPLPTLLHQRAAEELRALAQGHPRALASAPVVTDGQPWRAICQAAEDLGVDLIVIGSHGYAGWDRLLGTTAQHVVNHSTRSVLVVHSKDDA